MTRRSVAILAFVAVLGVSAFAAADSLRPTPREEKAWLQSQLGQYKADAAAWDRRREVFDHNTIRPLRHRFRSLLIPIINETGGEARRDAQHALRVLAAPGPKFSIAKRLHTRTRRFGDEAFHLLNRHIGDVRRQLTLYP
ncbi:MAG: hypothetical protein ACRDMH_09185 [Solirubrobacterales bacterium]